MDRRQLLKRGTGSLIALAAGSFLPNTSLGMNTPDLSPLDRLRLCCNENPHGPSPLAQSAIRESISSSYRYPRKVGDELKATIAEVNGLTPEHVLLGAGSASILQLMGLWIGQQKKDIVSAEYTFKWLMRYAQQLGSEYIKVPLNKDMYIDLEAIKGKISKNTGLVYVCNPNNPTGTYISAKHAHPFYKEMSNTAPVFVDEAYIEYTADHPTHNTAHLIRNHPNIMVCRTFSKIYGMAGLRIGYLLADPTIIEQLEKIDVGMGISVAYTSLAAAIASLKDQSFLQYSLKENERARNYLQQHLRKWNIPYHDATANFVHCDISKYGKDIKAELEKQNISLNPIHRDEKTYLRISIGSHKEMELFASRMNDFFTK